MAIAAHSFKEILGCTWGPVDAVQPKMLAYRQEPGRQQFKPQLPWNQAGKWKCPQHDEGWSIGKKGGTPNAMKQCRRETSPGGYR